jgi:hypothetical protein
MAIFAFWRVGEDRRNSLMKNLSPDELHEVIRRALDEVSRRLASGELDQSGRCYTDAELAAGAATGRQRKAGKSAESPAA